jgi:apolipoprotein N-acyltransferase
MRLKLPNKSNIISLSLGIVCALGNDPWALWHLSILSLIIWFWLVIKNTVSKNIFKKTFIFGFGYFSISLIWIVEPFLVQPWIHGWIAPIALIVLPSFLALIWALFAFLGHYYLSSIGIVIGLSLAEYCRLYLFTGFPWATISYVLLDTKAEKWLSILGPYGLSLFLLLTCFTIAFTLRVRKKINVFLASCIIYILFFVPHFFEQEPVKNLDVSVRLIQPNAVQEKKWSEEFAPIFFENMIEMTAQQPKPDIVIWPETSLYLPYNAAFEELDKMRAAAGESILIFGALKLDQTNFLKNSLIIENRNQDAIFYDKAKLVPFGEYFPFTALISYFKISEQSNLFGWGFKKGNGPELLNLTNGLKFIPLICYEAIFPNFLKPSVQNADFILQITNDAWFGKSIGPQQHLAQLRIRAIEYGLPVIRVANTGITAIIDANGKVVENLSVNKSGFLDSFIPSRKKSTVYGLFGDLIFLSLILLTSSVAFINNKFINHKNFKIRFNKHK